MSKLKFFLNFVYFNQNFPNVFFFSGKDKGSPTGTMEEEQKSTFDCFELIDPTSPDTEFDETLGIEGLDEVTVVTLAGEEVVIKRSRANSTNQITEIPYTVIFKPPQKFNQKQRKLFLPGVDITVEVNDFERNVTHHILNPNL